MFLPFVALLANPIFHSGIEPNSSYVDSASALESFVYKNPGFGGIPWFAGLSLKGDL